LEGNAAALRRGACAPSGALKLDKPPSVPPLLGDDGDCFAAGAAVPFIFPASFPFISSTIPVGIPKLEPETFITELLA
jgi:hypothetical protein